MSGSLEKRFRRKCSPKTDAGCVEWRGWVNNSGYGMIKSSKRPYSHLLAHRVAYELHYGPVPQGMEVMHSCDNKKCVNWEHLSVGSRQENMNDMVSKDRQKRSALSDADALAIRDLRSRGLTQREIAMKYGVSRPLISLILSGRIARFQPSV